MAAIAQKESGGQAKPARYLESNGVYSVGLMSLSQGDAEAGSLTYNDLEDLYNNIRVAVETMTRLVRQYRVLHGPNNTGLSAYWSTFR